MQFSRKSFSNLAALESGEESLAELQGGGPLASFDDEGKESNASLGEAKGKRLVFVSNHLPVKMSRNEVENCYTFELDEDSLLVQAANKGMPEDMTPVYVGCLSKEIPIDEQDEVAAVLQKQYNCYPVRIFSVAPVTHPLAPSLTLSQPLATTKMYRCSWARI